MKRIWTDARLGEFTFDKDLAVWETVVAAPAFDAFRYDWGKKPTDPSYTPPDGRYALQIADDEAEAADRTAAVALALKVLANQASLVEAIIVALWDDFNNRGPDSGMWWHGDYNFPDGDTTGRRGSFLREGLASDGWTLDGPEDLKSLMGLQVIIVRQPAHSGAGRLVELGFDAAFEMEHGVGILTDRNRILGTGYQVDVHLFK